MDLEVDNKFNNFGWKSKIICNKLPEITNIIIPDNIISDNLVVLISQEIESELTTECKIFLNDKLYVIENIIKDSNDDFITEISLY